MYTYRYLNRHLFKNSVSFSLIIENDESSLVYRLEKCFKIDSNLIDDEFLRTEAKKEIENLKNILSNTSDNLEQEIEETDGDSY